MEDIDENEGILLEPIDQRRHGWQGNPSVRYVAIVYIYIYILQAV